MFFFKKTTKAKYISYLSKVMKYKCILDLFRQDEKAKHALLLYFFDQTREDITRLLTATQLPYQDITLDSLLIEGFNLLNARELENKIMPSADVIYVLEVHPLYSVNAIPLEAAKKKEIKELTYFTGMDESVMKIFGSERMVELLQRLGLKDDESISHDMVDKSIERGQKKIEEKIKSPIDIRTSAEEWAARTQLDRMV